MSGAANTDATQRMFARSHETSAELRELSGAVICSWLFVIGVVVAVSAAKVSINYYPITINYDIAALFKAAMSILCTAVVAGVSPASGHRSHATRHFWNMRAARMATRLPVPSGISSVGKVLINDLFLGRGFAGVQ